jgi:hypothetical protein
MNEFKFETGKRIKIREITPFKPSVELKPKIIVWPPTPKSRRGKVSNY